MWSKLNRLVKWLIPSKEEWTNHSFKDKLEILVAYSLLVAAFMGAVRFLMPSSLPLDYIDTKQPYLEASLEIYKVDSTGIHYNYIIRNNGSLPAKNVRFSQRNEGLLMGEFEGNQRDLAPNGEMLVKNSLMVSISSMQLKNINKFVLIASYDTNFGEINKSYNSTFIFSIPFDEVTIGTFKYNDVRRDEGKFNQEKFGKFLEKEWPKITKRREIKPEEVIESHSPIARICNPCNL